MADPQVTEAIREIGYTLKELSKSMDVATAIFRLLEDRLKEIEARLDRLEADKEERRGQAGQPEPL